MSTADYSRAWRARNPEKVRAAAERYRDARRARRAAARAEIEAAEAAAQLEARRAAVAPFADLLEARARALKATAAAGARTEAGRVARIRRAEVLSLLAYLRAGEDNA